MSILRGINLFLLMPVLVACQASALNKSDASSSMRQCNTNEQCIAVQEGCCNCNNGGKKTFINKNWVERWTEQRNERCSLQGICMAVISLDKSCQSVPRCIKGRCRGVFDMRDGEKK